MPYSHLSTLSILFSSQLRAAHASGNTTAGVDILTGEVGDMQALGIREAYKSKLQVCVDCACVCVRSVLICLEVLDNRHRLQLCVVFHAKLCTHTILYSYYGTGAGECCRGC